MSLTARPSLRISMKQSAYEYYCNAGKEDAVPAVGTLKGIKPNLQLSNVVHYVCWKVHICMYLLMHIQNPQSPTHLYVLLTLAWFKHKVTSRGSCCKIYLPTFYSFLVPPHVFVESWSAEKYLYYVYVALLCCFGVSGNFMLPSRLVEETH